MTRMKSLIIVLSSGQLIETRSWACACEDEAECMIKWLTDNFIDAMRVNHKQWDRMAAIERGGTP